MLTTQDHFSVTISLYFTVPPFEVTPREKVISRFRGDHFKFSCVYGVPTATTVVWTKRVDKISYTIPENRITTSVKDGKTVRTLSFKKLTLNDTGKYICSVNVGGQRQKKGRVLHVKGK